MEDPSLYGHLPNPYASPSLFPSSEFHQRLQTLLKSRQEEQDGNEQLQLDDLNSTWRLLDAETERRSPSEKQNGSPPPTPLADRFVRAWGQSPNRTVKIPDATGRVAQLLARSPDSLRDRFLDPLRPSPERKKTPNFNSSLPAVAPDSHRITNAGEAHAGAGPSSTARGAPWTTTAPPPSKDPAVRRTV